MARTTKRSEVVSMVATCGYPLAVLALLKKGLGNVFPTSGQWTNTEWEYISLCLLRFEFCKKPVGRTYQRSWYISAHFVICKTLGEPRVLIRSVKTHTGLLLTKVTKPCIMDSSKRKT